MPWLMLTLIASASSDGRQPELPPLSEIIDKLENARNCLVCSRIEYRERRQSHHDGRDDYPITAGAGASRWLCVFPEWIKYNYATPGVQLDISELPSEIRWNGRCMIKANLVSRCFAAFTAPDEATRHVWSEPNIVQALQYDLLAPMGLQAKSRSFYLPSALKSADVRVVGYEQMDGLQTIRVNLSRSDSVWLARDFGWAPVKRVIETTSSAGSPARTAISHAGHTRSLGSWLPRQMRISIDFGKGGFRTESYTVASYDRIPEQPFNPPMLRNAMWRIEIAKHLHADFHAPGPENQFEKVVSRLAARMAGSRIGDDSWCALGHLVLLAANLSVAGFCLTRPIGGTSHEELSARVHDH